MKPELKNAAVDFFDACAAAEKVEAFVFMSSLISAHDITHVSYAPNEGIGTDDLLRLFDACPFEDKLETFAFVIGKWTESSKSSESAPL